MRGMTREFELFIKKLKEQEFLSGYNTGREESTKDAYDKGLNDAWEAARKLSIHPSIGGLDDKAYKAMFGDKFRMADQVLNNLSASEAIAKIKAYEEQKKAEENEIKVGDEVVGVFGFRGVVVGIHLPSNEASILSTEHTVPQMYPLNNIRSKTGRHFPQIEEVLKQLQEGEE